MKNIAFTVFTLLIIIGLGAGGYFALRALNDPALYVSDTTEKIGDIHIITTDAETGINQNDAVIPVPVTAADSAPEPVETDLKSSIEKLASSKTVLKVGSKGASVGYIQEFMNQYFDKTLKIDNDFGKTLEANVKAFQKAVGVSQTGQVGPMTLQKMIDWLAKN